MPYTYFNPNPFQHFIEDCAARALSKALSIDWDMASAILANAGIKMGYNADDKRVFYAVLREQGFDREVIPNTCPDCYTAEDFCIEHPKGTYILGFGDHVAAGEYGRYSRRDSMGRYASDKSWMEKLKRMEDEAPNEKARREVEEFRRRVERM